jgi:vitamin B12 transport system permease protein
MDYLYLLSEKRKRWFRTIGLMAVLLLFLSLIYLFTGEVLISPLHPISSFEQQLIVDLRLPRLLAAMMIGACLAVSGATLQVLLGNVLAEPGVIGVSGGASVAMVVAVFFFPQSGTSWVFMLSAIGGAFTFTCILVGIAQKMRLTTVRLLLVGVALGILSSAIVTWAFYFSSNLNMRQLMYWLMGSIGGIDWTQHSVTFVAFPALLWLLMQGRRLDRLMMGEIHAAQLGLDVYAMRWKLIVAVSILVGVAVALGGIIGFVGLVVPHLLRLWIGSDNRYLLPASAVTGALLVVFADLIARTVMSAAELPLGVVTTSIGTPIFIWMLLKNHDTR